jgi:hypothetical protein
MITRRWHARPLATAVSTASILSLVPVLLFAQQPAPVLTMVESGFDVTDLGTSSGPKGAACSPGGVWGDYVYIGESSGNAIERVDFADNVSLFAMGMPDIDFPVGMDFGPGPANDFGTYLLVASYGSGRITRLDPLGMPSLLVMFPSVSDVKFDPTGAYGTDLFAIEYFGAISTVTPGGVITPFASGISSSYFRFGPGGPWGTGMYATSNASPGPGIVTVAMDGTPTLFAGGFITPEQFDWAFGGPWGGDMFATDYSSGDVYRIHSDGTKTVFATTDSRPAGMVFCNDCLYITSYGGGCWKVCESAVATPTVSWSAVKQQFGGASKSARTPDQQ